MTSFLTQLIQISARINLWMGKYFSFCAFFMVLLMCGTVVMRYGFQSSAIWQQELVRYLHAILFLSVAGYSLHKDKHVRVDIFYHKLNKRMRAIIDLLGSLFLLLPFAFCIIFLSYDFIINAWAIHEGSGEYQGLPGLYLLKSFMWVYAIGLIIAAIEKIAQSCLTLFCHEAPHG